MLTPDTRLRRKDTARALTEAGFPIAESTLAKLASIGGGPPYDLFGRIPLYTWGITLAWARQRCRPRGQPLPAASA